MPIGNCLRDLRNNMKKKILIDASTVVSIVDGLSHCIINLIKYLPEESFDKFDYTILVNKGLKRKALTDLLKDSRLRVIEKKISPIGPKRDWQMFWFLRKYKKQFDLVHITSNNYPFALKKGLATVTDITFKQFFDNPKFTFNLATFYMDKVIRNALRRSKAVVAISQATKDDLVKTYRLAKPEIDKIHVVHLGWEHLANEKQADIKGCEEELLASKDYLLYVGTFRVHKNVSTLLLAFQKAIATLPANKKLVIIGSDRYLKASDLEVIGAINANVKRVLFTGYLTQSCVEKYFQHADAYIFPSLSEGFGLGVLETFFYDIPLLCSNLTSLPEIAGDAAMYFDPRKADDITAAMLGFYANPAIGKDLVTKGKERLKGFSWKKNAAEIVKLYEKYS